MNDLKEPANPPSQSPQTGGDDRGGPRTMARDHIRVLIAAELDRLDPLDQSRPVLETLVEASVRLVNEHGEITIQVVDEAGKPRVVQHGGRTEPFTIRHLAEELRARHPALFNRAPPAQAEPAGRPVTVAPGEPATPPPPTTAPRTESSGSGIPSPSAPVDEKASGDPEIGQADRLSLHEPADRDIGSGLQEGSSLHEPAEQDFGPGMQEGSRRAASAALLEPGKGIRPGAGADRGAEPPAARSGSSVKVYSGPDSMERETPSSGAAPPLQASHLLASEAGPSHSENRAPSVDEIPSISTGQAGETSARGSNEPGPAHRIRDLLGIRSWDPDLSASPAMRDWLNLDPRARSPSNLESSIALVPDVHPPSAAPPLVRPSEGARRAAEPRPRPVSPASARPPGPGRSLLAGRSAWLVLGVLLLAVGGLLSLGLIGSDSSVPPPSNQGSAGATLASREPEPASSPTRSAAIPPEAPARPPGLDRPASPAPPVAPSSSPAPVAPPAPPSAGPAPAAPPFTPSAGPAPVAPPVPPSAGPVPATPPFTPSSNPALAAPPAMPSSGPAQTAGEDLRGVPEVVDLATLRLNERVVRLFGVESRGSSPDELRRYLRGREVACTPQPLSETYRCTVNGQDLSMVVIFNGGGRAAEDSTPELKNAERRARDAKVGLWAGT